MPIETAPRDGTRVLLWTDTRAGDADLLGYVQTTCEGEHIALAQTGSYDARYLSGWDIEKIGEPTHWMPLPPAPEQKT